MKVIDSTWFTQLGNQGTIGIVSGLDEITGEVKIYIGSAQGYNQSNDEELILKTGAKISSLDITNFTILSNMRGSAMLDRMRDEENG